ncbi:MAG: VIT1/CCC1 transporter family protein [bacterium]|nr:VIT1/CCC1 transporter family protein [bacterium]
MDTHKEHHFTAADAVRDIIIGASDGFTMPFAIAAGLTGASVAVSIVITAGLAEIVAGAISMGLGGYLAAKSQADHYDREYAREELEVEEKPEAEAKEVMEVLQSYGLTEAEGLPIVHSLKTRKKDWIEFMMRYELGLERPDRARAWKSALTIGFAYTVAGIIPLAPYIFFDTIGKAFVASSIVTLCALMLFGYLRGTYTALKPFRSIAQTVMVGVLAASAAFAVAKLIQ